MGTLKFGGEEILVVFRFEETAGKLSGELLSPEQHPYPIPMEVVEWENGRLAVRFESLGSQYEGRANLKSGRIRGDYAVEAFETSLDLERGEAGFTGSRAQTPVPPFPYEVRDVTFLNPFSEESLAGTLTVPEGQLGNVGAAILISDFGPSDRNGTAHEHQTLAVLADALTREGLAVFRYDDRGVGKSTGTYRFGTTMDFATDAWAAVEWLKEQSGIDPLQIGLIGHGEGGVIASVVATKREDLAWVVLLGTPLLPGKEALLAQIRAIAERSGLERGTIEVTLKLSYSLYEALVVANPDLERIDSLVKEYQQQIAALPPEQMSRLGDLATLLEHQFAEFDAPSPSPWLGRYLQIDPGDLLKSIHVPVFALWGALDVVAPPAKNQRVFAEVRPKGESEVLDGLNHLFQEAESGLPSESIMLEDTMEREVPKRLLRWIQEQKVNR